jgi:hypothetical protein
MRDADQGVFTYALLSALQTPSASGKDGVLSLKETYDYVLPMVQRIRPTPSKPQTPQFIAPRSLADMMLERLTALHQGPAATAEHTQ